MEIPVASQRLHTDSNPKGTITNSNLELAGGLVHLYAICEAFNICEQMLLSKTDNLATLFWQQKGSATTDMCPNCILDIFGVHQHLHRYITCHDYLPGPSNPIADALLHLFNLTNTQFCNAYQLTANRTSSITY